MRDLPHLDRLVEQSGSSVVAVAFYSRVRLGQDYATSSPVTRLDAATWPPVSRSPSAQQQCRGKLSLVGLPARQQACADRIVR